MSKAFQHRPFDATAACLACRLRGNRLALAIGDVEQYGAARHKLPLGIL